MRHSWRWCAFSLRWYKSDMTWRNTTYRLPLGGGIRLTRVQEGRHDQRPMAHASLPGHWYFHLYNCRANLTLNGVRMPILPGYTGMIRPHDKVLYRWDALSSHLFAHFEPLDLDSHAVELPAMQDLGDRFEAIANRLSVAIHSFPTHPGRAATRVCDILWDIALPDSQCIRHDAGNRVVEAACSHIEQWLNGEIRVAEVGRKVDVTPSHLARLFRKYLGTTVLGYVRQRRAMRAKHLLLHSSLPMKAIAMQVGLPDPHHFNKTIRREFGMAPTQIRAQGLDG